MFLGFEAALPWAEWSALGWQAPAVVCAVLVLRRLPAVLLLSPRLLELRSPKEALYAAWFGPLGVGALFFSLVAAHETGIPELWTIGSLLIAATIVVHDLTIIPFSRHLRP